MVADNPPPAVSGQALVELLREALIRGNPVTFRARGASMSPFIREGDLVTVGPLKGSPGRGRVALFIHPQSERLTIHRVIEQRGDSLITSGDNAPHGDGPIPAGNLLGYVTRVQHRGRDVSLGLGPERSLIAFLTSRGLLMPLLQPLRKVGRLLYRRQPPS